MSVVRIRQGLGKANSCRRGYNGQWAVPLSHCPYQPAYDEAVNPDSPLDLDTMERDLADVEFALGRLDNGTYWKDEITGELIEPGHLAANPTARRNP